MPDSARPVGEKTFQIPEIMPTPELMIPKQEKADEREIPQQEKQSVNQESPPTAIVPVASQQTALVATTKSPLRHNIEKILEEDLRSLYLELEPDRQLTFRQQGELTASRIEYLLAHVKVKIDYLVSLIRRWLLLIPRVNQYFLEQEAKIKAEKILFLNTKE
ncbi:MAG: hypothetical protein Q8P11_01260 [bacterium]|nr:hypothetical protein [bacterium]